MRCNKCENGVLQIKSVSVPKEGWSIKCSQCDFHEWLPYNEEGEE